MKILLKSIVLELYRLRVDGGSTKNLQSDAPLKEYLVL